MLVNQAKQIPSKLSIFLHNKCNLRCRYCFVKQGGYQKNRSSLIVLKRQLKHFLLAPGTAKLISLSGGEPLLSFGVIKDLTFFIEKHIPSSKSYCLNVTTNGTLLTEEHIAFFNRHKFELKISIDGTRRAQDLFRPFRSRSHGSSYDVVKRAIKKACSSNLALRANLVFPPENVSGLLKNIIHLHQLGFASIDFFPPIFSEWTRNQLTLLNSFFYSFTKFYKTLFSESSTPFFTNSFLTQLLSGKDIFKPLVCDKYHLDIQGNYYLCDKVFGLDRHQREHFTYSNLTDFRMSATRNRELNRIRHQMAKIIKKDCRECSYVRYCFCPVGHFIYYTEKKMDLKKNLTRFCVLSQLYIRHFNSLKVFLLAHPRYYQRYCSQDR